MADAGIRARLNPKTQNKLHDAAERRREARVNRAKVVDYLLSLSHPDGRSKAAFFLQFGFSIEKWETLAEALRELGVSNPVAHEVESAYGRRYTVDGLLRTPDGRSPRVRTVWIVEPGTAPRLVTAYPLEKDL